jgi:hypothetical protein
LTHAESLFNENENVVKNVFYVLAGLFKGMAG